MDNETPVQEPQSCPRAPPPNGPSRRALLRRQQKDKKKALAEATSASLPLRGSQEGLAVTVQSIENFKAKTGASFEAFLKVYALNPLPPPSPLLPRARTPSVVQCSVMNHCQQAPHCTSV